MQPANKYMIPFPAAAVGVSVSECKVDAGSGAIEAQFEFYARRWHPSFLAFVARVAVSVAKATGFDVRTVAGVREVFKAARNIFDFYAPENANAVLDDDTEATPSTVAPSVSMREVPALAGARIAAQDIAPRWFLPWPGICK